MINHYTIVRQLALKYNIVKLKKYINIITFILSLYSDKVELPEAIYRLRNNIFSRPVCKVCGRPLEFKKYYSIYCSNSCQRKDPDNINKLKETCLTKYGTDNPAKSKQIIDKAKETCNKKYGGNSPMHSKDVVNKRTETNIKKYGVTVASQLEDIKIKSVIQRNITKKENNTFNTSKPEDETYNLLIELFPDIIRQYTSDKYPFTCDFYIPSYDLYIECNYHWTHGEHAYNEIYDKDKLQDWVTKSKTSKFYINAIETWTVRDVKKRNIAKINNLNYLELWSINELKTLLLYINEDDNELHNEYNYFIRHKGKLTNNVKNNKIIKYFQQNTFFKNEKILFFTNKDIRNKLINNRKKYLNTNVLSIIDILGGFKKSGIYYGYSHFNPLLFKWFIEQYNIKTCYDPCGGWGHRLLGSSQLDLYIYNDLSKQTYNNVNKIIDYFNIQNTVTYCEDANTFMPNETFEAMFTCPPYFNLEQYECGDFTDINEYNLFINNLFTCFYNSNANIFGLIIREDLLVNHDDYFCKFDITSLYANHLNKTGKKNKEYLYIFKR